jgi:aryl-alcohol dehydrogenase-like predicted oxidoreductase
MAGGRLSLGTAQLGMAYGVANRGAVPSEVHAAGVLAAAVELGIDCLDTAPAYGVAEQRIGTFLRDHDLQDEIAICTKLESLRDVPTERVAREVDHGLTSSLRHLGADCIDCFLLHDAADLTRHGDALVAALVEQQARGRVLDIGVSVYSPEELDVLERFPELGVVQHPFNLLDRRLLADAWPARLGKRDVKLQLRSVLLQGLLALEPGSVPAELRSAGPLLEKLRAVAVEFDATPLELAVAFAVALEPDRVIVAADSARQLEALVAAAEQPVPQQLGERLDAVLGAVPLDIIDPRRWSRP